MARIRSIKPEFWSSEQVMELSPLARLAFIGMWTFADDGGVHPASSKTLKAEVFPSDDLTAEDVGNLIGEMVAQRLILEFGADGKRYWQVTGWARHQRIDKPTFRHPQPENSPTTRGTFGESSANPLRTLGEPSTPERSGEERSGEEGSGGLPVPDGTGCPRPSAGDQQAGQQEVENDNCPHDAIVGAYHELLPMGRKVRIWNDARRTKLRARWREDKKRQSVEWWRKLFGYIAKSDFLTGRTSSAGRAPFEIDLEWIITPANLVKIIEGKYDNRESSQ